MTLKQDVEKIIRDYSKGPSFTNRKLTDTPTDDLSIVNRKYVNMSGTTAQRPNSPVVGQQYFETTIGRPVFFDGTDWVDGAGSVS